GLDRDVDPTRSFQGEEFRADPLREGLLRSPDRSAALCILPNATEPRARRDHGVIEPSEVVDPLNRCPARPQDFREEVVSFTEAPGLGRLRAAGMLRLLEGGRHHRLRRQQRLEGNAPNESSPSHEDRTVLVTKRASARRAGPVYCRPAGRAIDVAERLTAGPDSVQPWRRSRYSTMSCATISLDAYGLN